jgi:hypothetical protein
MPDIYDPDLTHYGQAQVLAKSFRIVGSNGIFSDSVRF